MTELFKCQITILLYSFSQFNADVNIYFNNNLTHKINVSNKIKPICTESE